MKRLEAWIRLLHRRLARFGHLRRPARITLFSGGVKQDDSWVEERLLKAGPPYPP